MAKKSNISTSKVILSNQIIIIISVAFAFLLYGNTLKSGYNLDDELVTINHRLTSKGISAIPEIFASPYYQDEMGYSYEYRPVTLATFAIEHQFFGDNPFTSHLINLLLYLLCIIIFIRLITAIAATQTVFFLFFSVLLFAAHPMHTEVVSSIKNRDELLSLIGGLVSFVFALRFVDKGNYLYLPLIALVFMAALLSKMSVFSFALIIPFWLIITNVSVRKIVWISSSLIIPAICVLLLRKLQLNHILVVSAGLSLLLIAVYVLLKTKISNYITSLPGSIKNAATYSENNFVKSITIADIVVLIVTVAVVAYSIFSRNFFSIIPVLAIVFAMPYLKSSHNLIDIFLPGLLIAFLGAFLETKHLEWLYFIFIADLFYKLQFSQRHQLFAFFGFTLLFSGSYFLKSGLVPEADRVIIPLFFIVTDLLLDRFNVRKNISGAIWIGLILLMFILSFLVGELDIAPMIFPVALFVSRFAGRKMLPRLFSLAIVVFFALAVYNVPSPFIKISFKEKPVNEKEEKILPNEKEANLIIQTNNQPAPLAITENNGIDRPLDFVEFPLGFSPTFSEKYGTVSYVLGYYFKMMFAPYPMCYYYGYNKVNVVQLYNLWAILSVIIHLALGLSALYFIRKHPVYSIGILSYLSSIFLFSNLVSPVAGMIGDRLTFVASFGFCIAIGYVLNKVYESASTEKRKLVTGGFAVVLILYSGLTIARNAQWKNHMTLFKHDMKFLEESAQAHNLLAKRLILESFDERSLEKQYKMREEGIKHFEKAIKIYPDFFNPHVDLGKAYLLVDRFDDATKSYLKAYEMDSTYTDALYQAGGIFSQTGKYTQAIICFEKVIQKDKTNVAVYASLSEIYFKQKNFEKAIEVNINAMEKFPSAYEPVVNIGKTYFTMGDKANALIYFEKAYLINPSDRNLVLTLASLYKELGNKEKSDFYFSRASQISR